MIRRYLRGPHSFVSKSVVLSFDERKLTMTLSDLGRTRSCCVFAFRARVTLLTSSIEFISVVSNPTSSLAFRVLYMNVMMIHKIILTMMKNRADNDD